MNLIDKVMKLLLTLMCRAPRTMPDSTQQEPTATKKSSIKQNVVTVMTYRRQQP